MKPLCPINLYFEKENRMDDLISRQAAIDVVKSRKTAEQCEKGVVRNWAVDLCVDALEKLPSAERLGLWEDIEHAPNGLLYVTCSVCGKRQTVEFTSYCGNCGVKMERE